MPQLGHQPVWGLGEVMTSISSENILDSLQTGPTAGKRRETVRGRSPVCLPQPQFPHLVVLHLSGEEKRMEASV